MVYKLAQDKFDHEFMFITDYPAEKRAFYHMRNEDGILQGYDLIWRGVEITTGAQREHRYEELVKNAREKGLGKMLSSIWNSLNMVVLHMAVSRLVLID